MPQAISIHVGLNEVDPKHYQGWNGELVACEFDANDMPVAVRGRFSGELICYARSVVHQEWPQMESGSLGDGFNPW